MFPKQCCDIIFQGKHPSFIVELFALIPEQLRHPQGYPGEGVPAQGKGLEQYGL